MRPYKCCLGVLSGLLFVAGVTLAAAPEWSDLDEFQATLTRAQFKTYMTRIYAPDGRLDDRMRMRFDAAAVFASAAAAVTGAPLDEIFFAPPNDNPRAPAHSFRDPDDIRALGNSSNAPLRGLRIMLDPGHIGGEWARIEERWFWLNRVGWPVQEAALTRYVARLLRVRLEAAGAEVRVTCHDFTPVTTKRPDDYRARDPELISDPAYAHLPDIFREGALLDIRRKRREFMFIRGAEIQARADLVNAWRHDLTLCLHFNAAGGAYAQDTSDNRLLFLIHGNYLPAELHDETQLHALFRKLLEGSHDTERRVAEALAQTFVEATGLPPCGGSDISRPLGTNIYVQLRNLAANRLYRGPVVFLEPYYQNNAVVYARIQMGDYDGVREVEGHPRPSIFREYAAAACAGILRAYALANAVPPPAPLAPLPPSAISHVKALEDP